MRDFFYNMASKLGDNMWGCLPQITIRVCILKQAIEASIEFNLDKVEAGAQGEHKIKRGYMPVTTYSSHYIVYEEFSEMINDFLAREKNQDKEIPLCAVATTLEIEETLTGFSYFKTFHRNPVCTAAGFAVLNVIERANLQDVFLLLVVI